MRSSSGPGKFPSGKPFFFVLSRHQRNLWVETPLAGLRLRLSQRESGSFIVSAIKNHSPLREALWGCFLPGQFHVVIDH